MARRAPIGRQRGISGAFVIIAIVVIGLAVLLARSISGTDVSLQGEIGTRSKQQRVAEALTAYVVTNRRLPCPAVGTDDAGDAAPAIATANCTDDAGVVPWKALGLRREDSVDGWGRKLSYRVYDGATGLTQADGVSATDCNTSIASGTGPVVAGGKCNPTDHVNTLADFVAGKGLTVVDQGTNKTGIAFALISHGETGLGAYAAEGAGRGVLPTVGGDEASNTGATPPYYARTKSAAGIASSDANYFDDVVLYKSIAELVAAAQMAGRAWGANAGSTASQAFDRAALTAAGITPSNNLGANTIDFGAFSVQAFGSGARNVSSGVGTSGEGIGAIATGGTASGNTPLNSSSSEFLRFLFDAPGRSLGITVVDFGTSGGQFERVRLTFFLSGTLVGSPITKTACQSGAVQANYSVSPGSDFDRVDVAPINTTGGNNTTLLVGSLRSCNASVTPSLCVAPTAVPANNCP